MEVPAAPIVPRAGCDQRPSCACPYRDTAIFMLIGPERATPSGGSLLLYTLLSSSGSYCPGETLREYRPPSNPRAGLRLRAAVSRPRLSARRDLLRYRPLRDGCNRAHLLSRQVLRHAQPEIERRDPDGCLRH